MGWSVRWCGAVREAKQWIDVMKRDLMCVSCPHQRMQHLSGVRNPPEPALVSWQCDQIIRSCRAGQGTNDERERAFYILNIDMDPFMRPAHSRANPELSRQFVTLGGADLTENEEEKILASIGDEGVGRWGWPTTKLRVFDMRSLKARGSNDVQYQVVASLKWGCTGCRGPQH